MRKRCLILVFVLASAWSTGTCAFNSFETAGPIGEQVVALTFGIGLATTELGGGGTWYLVPQGRLTIGLLEGLDLGIQGGWKQPGGGAGATNWLGGLIDVKITSAHVPDMYTVAWVPVADSASISSETDGAPSCSSSSKVTSRSCPSTSPTDRCSRSTRSPPGASSSKGTSRGDFASGSRRSPAFFWPSMCTRVRRLSASASRSRFEHGLDGIRR